MSACVGVPLLFYGMACLFTVPFFVIEGGTLGPIGSLTKPERAVAAMFWGVGLVGFAVYGCWVLAVGVSRLVHRIPIPKRFGSGAATGKGTETIPRATARERGEG